MRKTVTTRVLFLTILLAGLALAGCVSEDGQQADEVPPGAVATVTDRTGGVQGTVLSDEGLPISGATVGIPQVGASSLTDPHGRFALGDLPPGLYQLFVQKLGFESKGVRVDVRAGDITTVDVQLAAVAIVDARHVTIIWNGYMKCSIATQFFLSEECGEGLGTPIGTFGKDPNNKIDWHFDQTARPATLLTETTWEPASQFAAAMNIRLVKNMACEPICEWEKEYNRASGPPPVRIVTDEKAFPAEASDYPLRTTLRHWADAGAENLVVVLEQPFEVYRTEFFGAAMEAVDPNFSALPPA